MYYFIMYNVPFLRLIIKISANLQKSYELSLMLRHFFKKICTPNCFGVQNTLVLLHII